MRFWLSGPRILGIRPGIIFRPDELLQKHKQPQKSHGCFIYVIRNENSFLKIGISSDPITRLAQLRTASAVPLSIEYAGALRCDGFAIEAEAHRSLDRYRMNGEWFNCSPDIAVAAINVVAHNLHEPIASVDPNMIGDVIREAARQNKIESMSTGNYYARFMIFAFKFLGFCALCIVLFIFWIVVMIVTRTIK